jgi:hypothetical protein
MRRVLLILIIVVILIGAGVASWIVITAGEEPAAEPTPIPTPTPTCEPGVICITADQLCREYDENRFQADAIYKGNILDVSGRIGEIDKGLITDQAFLTLDCGLLSDVFTDLWCYFDEEDEDKLLSVEERDYAVVRGNCSGKGTLYLSLRHCSSVKVIEPPDDDDGWCFIATAAYGSYMDSNVDTLRQFRDSYLVTTPVGRGLVSAYYRLSPPVATFIDSHPSSKPVVRGMLWPAVALSRVAVSTTLVQWMAAFGCLALVSTALVWWFKRRSPGILKGHSHS